MATILAGMRVYAATNGVNVRSVANATSVSTIYRQAQQDELLGIASGDQRYEPASDDTFVGVVVASGGGTYSAWVSKKYIYATQPSGFTGNQENFGGENFCQHCGAELM